MAEGALARRLRIAPLAAAALAAAVGIALAPWIADAPSRLPTLLAATVGAAIGGLADRQRRWMLLLAVACGFAALHGRTLQQAGLPPVPNGSEVALECRVIDTPKPGIDDTTIFRVRTESGSIKGNRFADLDGYRFEVIATGLPPGTRNGSLIRTAGRCRSARPPANPGAFDLESYLQRQ